MELRTLKRVLNSGQRYLYVPIKMYINPHHEIQSGNGIACEGRGIFDFLEFTVPVSKVFSLDVEKKNIISAICIDRSQAWLTL